MTDNPQQQATKWARTFREKAREALRNLSGGDSAAESGKALLQLDDADFTELAELLELSASVVPVQAAFERLCTVYSQTDHGAPARQDAEEILHIAVQNLGRRL